MTNDSALISTPRLTYLYFDLIYHAEFGLPLNLCNGSDK